MRTHTCSVLHHLPLVSCINNPELVFRVGGSQRSTMKAERVREHQGPASNDSLYFSTASAGKVGE